MIERLQSVLDEMDGWLTRAGSDESTQVPRDELIQWHITLTSLKDQLASLQEASQTAVDAFLLRPSKSDSPASRPADPGRAPGQRLYQRLAVAMAALEQVLVDSKVKNEETVDE